MNWIWTKLDRKLNKKPEYFLLQTLLAFVSLLLVLALIGLMGREVLVAALGSSLFIAFLTPDSYTAQTRNLISSHLLAGGIGLGFFLPDKFAARGSTLPYYFWGSGRCTEYVHHGSYRYRAPSSRRNCTWAGNQWWMALANIHSPERGNSCPDQKTP